MRGVAFVGMMKKKNDFVPRRSVLGEIVKIGLPVAVQDGCIQIAFIVITVIANNRGVNDAAAVGVVEKMISFIFIVPSSMLATVSALAAQNIGAGKHDRAEQILRYALGIIVAYGVIAIAVVELFAPELVGLFIHTNAPTHITMDIKDPAGAANPIGNRVSGYLTDARYDPGILAHTMAIMLCINPM